MKILILTPYLPYATIGHGGGAAVRDLIAYLARQHELLVVSLVRPGEEIHIAEVEELGVRVTALRYADRGVGGRGKVGVAAQRARAWWRARRSGFPFYVEKYWSPDLSRAVCAAVDSFRPAAVQVEYLQMSLLLRDIYHRRAGKTRLVLNTHELGSLPRERRAALTGRSFQRRRLLAEAGAWRRLQVAATGWADTTLCVTDQDRDLLVAQGGSGVVTMPLGVDTEIIAARNDRATSRQCLFVGSFAHRPNRVAARLLVDTVWPRVTKLLPEARLVLAGRGSRRFLASREGRNGQADRTRDERARTDSAVEARGFVPELGPLFAQSRLFVAPLGEGGGIKIKILEAMARGIPVITTPIGAEGIVNESDAAVWISKADASFADAVVTAWRQPEEATERALRARRLVEKSYSWTTITERLVELYAKDISI